MAEWLSSDGRFCGGENSHFLDRIAVHNTAHGIQNMVLLAWKYVQQNLFRIQHNLWNLSAS